MDFRAIAGELLAPASSALRSYERAWAAGTVLSLCLLAGSGCASYQAFVPIADVTAPSPEAEHTAADYALGPAQQRWGNVQVWTHGAYREEREGAARTVVHIGFSVHNQGASPLRLDEKRLFLEDVALGSGLVHRIAPSHVDGNEPIGASSTRQIDAYFDLPRRARPYDVAGYRVSWAFQGPNDTIAEHTDFRSTTYAWRRSYAYYPGAYPWGWYYPLRPYPYYFSYSPYYYPFDAYPYPYWVGPPEFRGRVYGPRVLARPRMR
jgi:hypothetical protein